jgi:soluble lytic murein transglycosylase-like protein
LRPGRLLRPVADDEYLLAAVAAIQPVSEADDEAGVTSQQEGITPQPPVVEKARAGIDSLVDAIVQVESGGQARMVGRAGERGLMQIKRETWGDMTRSLFGRPVAFDKAFNPGMNRQVGAAYLAYLRRFLQGASGTMEGRRAFASPGVL